MDRVIHRLFEPLWSIPVYLPSWVKEGDYVSYGGWGYKSLHKFYNRIGFDTDVLTQSHAHEEPTAARPIGFPFNFEYEDFYRWGERAILRLHVSFYYMGKYAVAVPHVEPDPMYNPLEHITMYQSGDAVMGIEATKTLRHFTEDKPQYL